MAGYGEETWILQNGSREKRALTTVQESERKSLLRALKMKPVHGTEAS